MTASEQKAFLQPAMLTKINFNMTTAWLTIPLIILSWLIIVFIFDRLIHEKNKHAKRMALKMQCEFNEDTNLVSEAVVVKPRLELPETGNSTVFKAKKPPMVPLNEQNTLSVID